jgi:hypothetical protein
MDTMDNWLYGPDRDMEDDDNNSMADGWLGTIILFCVLIPALIFALIRRRP